MTFLWKRRIIFRELVAHAKKSFICILLKHGYVPQINNLLLIPGIICETYDDVFMTPFFYHIR